jgi:hypothetical protein
MTRIALSAVTVAAAILTGTFVVADDAVSSRHLNDFANCFSLLRNEQSVYLVYNAVDLENSPRPPTGRPAPRTPMGGWVILAARQC